MRTVAIIQARMGSSRLPGKVLMDLCGDTMLARVIERVRMARSIDEIVVATTKHHADDAIVRETIRLDATPVRGSTTDVLDRYLGAAIASGADRVVRITSDCPLLDPAVIDAVVASCGAEVDYASNTHRRTYPRGLDVECLHRDTLERTARMATSDPAREHVTAFVMERPELFEIRDVIADRDDSDLRWTVDAPDDLALVRALMAMQPEVVPYSELVANVRARPELMFVNAHVIQKALRVA